MYIVCIHSKDSRCWESGELYSVCVCVCAIQVYISRWGLKPEYTQTHGDSCHGGDLN